MVLSTFHEKQRRSPNSSPQLCRLCQNSNWKTNTAERSNRSILNAARSIIYSSWVPIHLWAEAIAYSVYTLNRVLSSTAEITPYESWYKKRPDVSHLRIFGSRTFVHIPESLRKKLDPKSREGIFVGYSETSKAFRV